MEMQLMISGCDQCLLKISLNTASAEKGQDIDTEGVGIAQPEKRKLQRDLTAASQYQKDPTTKMDRDFLQGHTVPIEQGEVVLSWKIVGLD